MKLETKIRRHKRHRSTGWLLFYLILAGFFLAGVMAVTGCTVATSQSPKGRVTYAAIGADSSGVKLSPDSLEITKNSNSAAFSQAATAAGAAYGAHVLTP